MKPVALILFVVLMGASRAAVADQPFDGMRVTFCGTSGPLPARDRAKPCVAIEVRGRLYLVDVGPEATENLQSWQMPMAQARAVFLSHLHSDHIGDLGEFNVQSWVAGRPAPLLLIGPSGVKQVAHGFNIAYRADQKFRRAHHERPGVPFPLKAAALQPQVIRLPQGGSSIVWSEDGLIVTAIRVAHDPATPALGYRFDYRGRSVVISGDTRKWPPLAEAARDADVLIHEAQNNDMMRQTSTAVSRTGRRRLGAILGDTVTYHTTPAEAGELARAAGVKVLVLTHLTQAAQPMFAAEAFARGVDPTGLLDWRLARDGMTIELPPASKEVRFAQR